MLSSRASCASGTGFGSNTLGERVLSSERSDSRPNTAPTLSVSVSVPWYSQRLLLPVASKVVRTGESGSMFSRSVSVYAKPKRFCSWPPNVVALTPA